MNKIFSLQLLLLLSMLFIACQNTNTKQKELERREREIELREKELEEKENTRSKNRHTGVDYNSIIQPKTELKISKFIYVIFTVKEPKLHHRNSIEELSADGYSIIKIPEDNYVTYDNVTYTSEIEEIPGYDENKQYQYMDMIEANVREKVTYTNVIFDANILASIRDKEEQYRISKFKAKIVDRKFKVFDSYKEASIHRNNNK